MSDVQLADSQASSFERFSRMKGWIAAQTHAAMTGEACLAPASVFTGVNRWLLFVLIQAPGGVHSSVGAYFLSKNEHDQGGDTLAKNTQNGYYDLQGNPRENLIKAATDINRAVYTHTPHPGTAGELRALEKTLFETWNKHQRGDW